VILWRVYYGDGTTFDSDMGEPQDAPCTNVQVIAEPHPEVGRRLWQKCDYYWYDGFWWGGDIVGFLDYLMWPGLKVVKFGRAIHLAEFRDIYVRAKVDPDFQPKSGWLPDERR
jgi:hypothetical protein